VTVQEGYQVLAEMKATLAARGWLRATSGNLSVRLDANRIAITASGTDKQRVRPDDVLVVDMSGRAIGDAPARASQETGIHLGIYGRTRAGAVFHVHTVFNNSVGEDGPWLEFQDHEMLKALGHDEPSPLRLPVLVNDPDLARLAKEAVRRLDPAVPGLLLRRHGVYAWGDTAPDALRHLEAFEFLFEWMYYQGLRASVVRNDHSAVQPA